MLLAAKTKRMPGRERNERDETFREWRAKTKSRINLSSCTD